MSTDFNSNSKKKKLSNFLVILSSTLSQFEFLSVLQLSFPVVCMNSKFDSPSTLVACVEIVAFSLPSLHRNHWYFSALFCVNCCVLCDVPQRI